MYFYSRQCPLDNGVTALREHVVFRLINNNLMAMRIMLLSLVFLLLGSRPAQAQKFKTVASLGMGVSGYFTDLANSNTMLSSKAIPFDGYRLAYLLGIMEEYQFAKRFVLGVGFMHESTSGSFFNDFDGSFILEEYDGYIQAVTFYSFDLPVYLKLKSKGDNGFHFILGSGVSMPLKARRVIEKVSGYMGSKPSQIEAYTADWINLKTLQNNKFGAFGMVRMGKSFDIGNRSFSIDLRYKLDFTSWQYPTAEASKVEFIAIKRQCLTLCIGAFL